MAGFFENEALAALLQLMAFAFLVQAFAANVVGLFRREMRFGRIAGMRLVGAVVETCTSIGLLLAGFGPMALAWGMIAGTLVSVMILVGFIPGQILQRPTFQGAG